MKFSSKEDVEVPIARVFGILSEFEAFERSAIRRGAEIQRLGDHVAPHVGQAWEVTFDLRGKQRRAHVELTVYEAPHTMVFESVAGGMNAVTAVDLVALSPGRTRISVVFEVKPTTLGARLLVQSMKLAKSNLTKRFKLRVAEYARDIEDRHARMA
ncbi:MAG: SRPBCC family protein [Rhodobacteraceae bacterium]|nr:MAG: SRPBCC family protein [Paracoccaceae bacterium]